MIENIYRDSVALDTILTSQRNPEIDYLWNDFRNLDFITNNTAGVNGTGQGFYRVRYIATVDSSTITKDDTLTYSSELQMVFILE